MIPVEPSAGLTGAGLLFICLAWGGIGSVTAWCFYRLLRSSARGRPDPPGAGR